MDTGVKFSPSETTDTGTIHCKISYYKYTMEYYSVIKKNELMPFAATWIDLLIVTLSEVSQNKKANII